MTRKKYDMTNRDSAFSILGQKRCSKCKLHKTFDQYFKDSSNTGGISAACKQCTPVKKRSASYYVRNKDIVLNKCKQNYIKDKDRILARSKEYAQKNKDKIKAAAHENYEANKVQRKAAAIKRYQANKTSINKKTTAARRQDPFKNMKHRLRSRLYHVFQGNKSRPTEALTGLKWQSLRQYIECQFTSTMTWDNIDIDHICPLSQAQNVAELEKLCHFCNLQPLLAKDNRAKQNRWTIEGEILCKELLGRDWIK